MCGIRNAFAVHEVFGRSQSEARRAFVGLMEQRSGLLIVGGTLKN